MSKMTQWEHFKKNYLGTTVIFIALFLATLIFERIRQSETWWFSFFFLSIGVIVIPLGNYFSWKKKFK